MDALIMAGGQGTRLRPLTFSLPKPHLPVGERPILEIIIRQLRRHGFQRVFVSLGFKGHLIRAYLTEAAIEGIEVHCLAEPEPLGTAGPLRLLPPDVDNIFMINGDILTGLDFGRVIRDHEADGTAYLTVVVHNHEVPLPYGVFDIEDGRIQGIREKPVLQMPVATGMYALDRRAIEEVPHGRSDMPDLINRLVATNRVRAFMSEEFWTDVADLADYERVNLDAERWNSL